MNLPTSRPRAPIPGAPSPKPGPTPPRLPGGSGPFNPSPQTGGGGGFDPRALLRGTTAGRLVNPMALLFGNKKSAPAPQAPQAPASPPPVVSPAPVQSIEPTSPASQRPTPPQAAPLQVTGTPQFQAQPKQVANLGLEKQGYLTEAGGLVEDYVTQGLKTGKFADVESARGAAGRQNDLRTSQALTRAREAAVQAGHQPGTAAYQRMVDEAMAGANSANLQASNNVNQMQRNYWQDAVKRGSELEATHYDRATSERAHDETRMDTQRIEDDKVRLENKGDTQTWINSIQDPKARQAALNAWQTGKDPRQAVAQMYDESGTIKSEFRSASPGQVKAEGVTDQVRNAFAGRVNPATGQVYTEAEINGIIDRYQTGSLNQQFEPINQAEEGRVDRDEFLAPIKKAADLASSNPAAARAEIAKFSPEQVKALLDPANAAQLSKLRQNGTVKKVTLNTNNVLNRADWDKQGIREGDIIEHNGKLFIYEGHDTDRWKKWGNTRRNSWIIGREVGTNNSGKIWQTGSTDTD